LTNLISRREKAWTILQRNDTLQTYTGRSCSSREQLVRSCKLDAIDSHSHYTNVHCRSTEIRRQSW